MQFETATSLIEYPEALARMEAHVADVIEGKQGGLIWFIEHPPLYTSGTSAKPEDLKDAEKFPVFAAGRGGQYTYHGPGQRIAYIMLPLKDYQKQPDIRQFVHDIEAVVIRTLANFGIESFRREGRVGIWVFRKNQFGREEEAKIAAIGIRVRKWVSFHGLSVNLKPDLSHFSGIVPCGLPEFGVTSLHDMGVNITMQQLDEALENNFRAIFTSKNAQSSNG